MGTHKRSRSRHVAALRRRRWRTSEKESTGNQVLLPDFVHKYRDLAQFWGWIKYHLRTYKERRDLIWQAFRPVFEAVEKGLTGPVHAIASETLAKLDARHVAEMWRKVMTRIGDDPEGAITAARALVESVCESVCKLIVDHLGLPYETDGDLNKLFKTTARSLKLAVDQHEEQVFKQILTGMGRSSAASPRFETISETRTARARNRSSRPRATHSSW